MNWTREQVDEYERKRAAKVEPITVNHATAIINRPSTDEQKLNKTEKAYLQWLRGQGYSWIGIQCITLKLGDDCRYTPDFWLLDRSGLLIAREVKGFFRDDAKVKIKVAARMFPFIHFSVVTKLKNASSSSFPFMHHPVKP